MPPEEDIFHDITDASGFQPSAELPLVWIIIGIGLLCLLILCLAFLIRHFSNQLTETRVNLAQHALEKLPALQEASANQSVQQSASDLSSLLRSTLTFTTKSPSAYQSQQEFHKNADFDVVVSRHPRCAPVVIHFRTAWT